MKQKYLIAAPWPPARSEIANNVADSQLPVLFKRADIALVGEQEVPPDISRLRDIPVLNVAAAFARYPDARLIAHLGNHSEHIAAASRSLSIRPGFAVLHDLVLHHALYNICYSEQRQADYVAALHQYYGQRGEEIGKAACADGRVVHREATQYPLFEPFLENALGVITHSVMAYERVAESDRWPVCRIGLPFAGPNDENRKRIIEHRSAQAETIAVGGQLRLMVFGHLGPNRGLNLLLKALTQLAEKRIRLDIFGSIEDRDSIEEQISIGGLQDAVTIHGYVDDETLEKALTDAHMAINLRSPTLGEASASQLRLYATGLPAVVTRHGWYAEQPPSAVRFVRVGNEISDLVLLLQDVLRAPRQLPVIVAAGIDHLLSEHHPEIYADALLQFIHRAHTPGLRLLLARQYSKRSTQRVLDLGIPHTGSLSSAIHHLLPTLSK